MPMATRDTIIGRNDSSGGIESMPTFHRDPSFEFMDPGHIWQVIGEVDA
jgi:hypothetical protein